MDEGSRRREWMRKWEQGVDKERGRVDEDVGSGGGRRSWEQEVDEGHGSRE